MSLSQGEVDLGQQWLITPFRKHFLQDDARLNQLPRQIMGARHTQSCRELDLVVRAGLQSLLEFREGTLPVPVEDRPIAQLHPRSWERRRRRGGQRSIRRWKCWQRR